MKLREVFEMLPEFDEDKCVLIAEKFAILFASWVLNDYDGNPDWEYKTINELLEIYKEEKGL